MHILGTYIILTDFRLVAHNFKKNHFYLPLQHNLVIQLLTMLSISSININSHSLMKKNYSLHVIPASTTLT